MSFSSLMDFDLVDRQIRFRQVELQQVRAACQGQRADGLGFGTSSRLQQVRDVLAGEGIEAERVLEGPRSGLIAVDLRQGEDLAQMRTGIQLARGQSLVVGSGVVAQRQELRAYSARA
jgi:hypothetical protein